MEKIKIVHDTVGHTLTVWLEDPALEHVCEETADEMVLIKAANGCVIGFEMLHYRPADVTHGLTVETVVHIGS